MMNTYFYNLPNYCGIYRYVFETVFDIEDNPKMVAEEAAKDYHYHHGGLEASWPLTFAIHNDKDGEELARFLVDREAEPVFVASKVNKSK